MMDLVLVPQLANVRLLKGAPLAVITVLINCAEPLFLNALQFLSGYSEKTVAKACYVLFAYGLAENTGHGWLAIRKPGQELKTPKPKDLLGSKISGSVNLSTLKEPIKDPYDFIKDQRTNLINLGFPALIKELNAVPEEKIAGLVNTSPRDHLPKPGSAFRTPASSEEQERLWSMLIPCGVQRNLRTRAMIALPHISAEFIQQRIDEFLEADLDLPKYSGKLILALEDPAARVTSRRIPRESFKKPANNSEKWDQAVLQERKNRGYDR